jgi:hypothetical protein
MITFVKWRFVRGPGPVYGADWPVDIQDITKYEKI